MAHLFRARIWPLIKVSDDEIITGASWMKAEDEGDAVSKWEVAVEQGEAYKI